MKPKFAVYVPHTAGRYQKRRFRKAACPIVERCGGPRRGGNRAAAGAAFGALQATAASFGARQGLCVRQWRRCAAAAGLAWRLGVLTRPFPPARHLGRRLTNSIMMHGRNNGKKLMAVSGWWGAAWGAERQQLQRRGAR